jgi:hypothetical protein
VSGKFCDKRCRDSKRVRNQDAPLITEIEMGNRAFV